MDNNETTTIRYSNTPKGLSDKEGCLRASYVGCGTIIVMLIIIGLLVYFRLDNFFIYGINHNLTQLQNKLNVERTLTDEQYYELSSYIKSLGDFIVSEGRNKETIIKFRKGYRAFQSALRDGRIERNELAMIRSAMLESEIPVVNAGREEAGTQQPKSENPVLEKGQ